MLSLPKIKVFAISNSEYKEMAYNYFFPSVRRFGFDVRIFDCDLPTGEFLTPEFIKVVDYKLSKMEKTICDNLGSIIIWSDVDVVFLRDPRQILLRNILNSDICGIRESNNKPNYINGGFIIIKCSEKTLNFWKMVRSEVKVDKYPMFYEQDAMNKLLNENILQGSFLNRTILPDTFWCEHRYTAQGMRRPEGLYIFHATYCKKLFMMKKMLEESGFSFAKPML